jgi:hypothetical protein
MRRALLLVVLVPLAVGCGAKESATGLDGSADAMKDAGSSRVEMKMTMDGAEFLYSATGTIDYARDRGELLISSSALPGGGMQGRFIGKKLFIGWDLAGKVRWQEQSDYEASGTERFIPGPGGASPNNLLSLLVKASKKVEILGTVDIRGVKAKHYRVHLDPKELPDNVTYGAGDRIVDAWIDEKGLVRRLRVPEVGRVSQGATIVDFFDFGVNVEVEAPPAEDIISEKEFSKLVEKECLMARGEKPPPESAFCAFGVGEGSGESRIEELPVTTVEEPP